MDEVKLYVQKNEDGDDFLVIVPAGGGDKFFGIGPSLVWTYRKDGDKIKQVFGDTEIEMSDDEVAAIAPIIPA